MPPFFKRKRRGASGPNKNQKKVMRGQEKSDLSEGILGERFPSVQKLSLRLDFITPQQQLFEQETRTFTPADSCDFSATCPGRCGGAAAFSFGPKIASVINSRQTSADARGTCQEPLFPGSPDLCAFQLYCKIDVSYGD